MVQILARHAALLSAVALALAASLGTAQGKHSKTIGDSGVSAQMLFLADPDHVIFMDKAENNPLSVNGHPGEYCCRRISKR
jgi:hypothetical protein